MSLGRQGKFTRIPTFHWVAEVWKQAVKASLNSSLGPNRTTCLPLLMDQRIRQCSRNSFSCSKFSTVILILLCTICMLRLVTLCFIGRRIRFCFCLRFLARVLVIFLNPMNFVSTGGFHGDMRFSKSSSANPMHKYLFVRNTLVCCYVADM